MDKLQPCDIGHGNRDSDQHARRVAERWRDRKLANRAASADKSAVAKDSAANTQDSAPRLDGTVPGPHRLAAAVYGETGPGIDRIDSDSDLPGASQRTADVCEAGQLRVGINSIANAAEITNDSYLKYWNYEKAAENDRRTVEVIRNYLSNNESE